MRIAAWADDVERLVLVTDNLNIHSPVSLYAAFADSISPSGWHLADQLARYVDWWQNGTYSVNGSCFVIGITSRSELIRFASHRDPLRSGAVQR